MRLVGADGSVWLLADFGGRATQLKPPGSETPPPKKSAKVAQGQGDLFEATGRGVVKNRA